MLWAIDSELKITQLCFVNFVRGFWIRSIMELRWLVLAIIPVVLGQDFGSHPLGSAKFNDEEEKTAVFVKKAEDELLEMTEKQIFIEWAYASNITDHNEKNSLAFQVYEI